MDPTGIEPVTLICKTNILPIKLQALIITLKLYINKLIRLTRDSNPYHTD